MPLSTTSLHPDTVHVYASADGYRWHRIAYNGRIVAESGEAYTRKADAGSAATRNNPECAIVYDDEDAA